MRVHAVLNRDGGTFRTTDMNEYCRLATRTFEGHGHGFSCEIVAGDEIEAALKKAADRDDLDAILAGGGDGTISAAAGICWKREMPLGVVPAGTMNLFARALKLPLDVYGVLDVLAKADIRNVDIATANGRPFIHQFSVGLHSRMVRFRNSYEFASRLGKMRASVRAAIGVILDPPVFHAELTIDGEEEHRRVSAIAISNNPFGDDPLLFADRVDQGKLGVYIAPALTPSGVARLVADILAGRRRANPDLDERTATAVSLHFPRFTRRHNAVFDGELVPLDKEVMLEIHSGELKVLMPVEGDKADPSS